jgi:hypothetical protein
MNTWLCEHIVRFPHRALEGAHASEGLLSLSFISFFVNLPLDIFYMQWQGPFGCHFFSKTKSENLQTYEIHPATCQIQLWTYKQMWTTDFTLLHAFTSLDVVSDRSPSCILLFAVLHQQLHCITLYSIAWYKISNTAQETMCITSQYCREIP